MTPRLDLGVASRTARGETASADRHLVHQSGTATVVAVVDGLGHGDEAARAATSAIRAIEVHAAAAPTAIVARVHDHLRGTRGVVLSLARIDLVARTLTWVGVGNVAGTIVRRGADSLPAKCSSLLLAPGIVGSNLPELRPETVEFPTATTLVLATDGIDQAFEAQVGPTTPVQILADRLLQAHGRHRDDCLVLVARMVEDAS